MSDYENEMSDHSPKRQKISEDDDWDQPKKKKKSKKDKKRKRDRNEIKEEVDLFEQEPSNGHDVSMNGDHSHSPAKKEKKRKQPKSEVNGHSNGHANGHAESPKKKPKKEEPAKWKWWEEEKVQLPEGHNWRSLEHKGPIFAPPYERLPKNIKFYYNGESYKLSNDAEEVMTFYAKMLDHDYTSKDTFNNNFMTDWREVMTHEEKKHITKLSKCDFSRVSAYWVVFGYMSEAFLVSVFRFR